MRIVIIADQKHLLRQHKTLYFNLSYKLVIELDGGQHVEQLDYDNNRTQYLTQYLEHFGFRVDHT